MRGSFFIVIALVCLATSGQAITVKSEPDFRFAWNLFKVVGGDDSIAVLAGIEGVQSAVYDKSTDNFVAVDQLLTNGDPWRIVSSDSVLLVIFKDRRAVILDHAALPHLVVRGTVQLPIETLDLAVRDSTLFFAAGFRGLLRMTLHEFSHMGVVDSTLDAVHAVAVDISGNRLVVLDDYNGFIEYSMTPSGEPQFESRQDLYFQGGDVVLIGDTVLTSTAGQDSLVMSVRDSAGWTLNKIFLVPFGCQSLFVMDTFVVTIAHDYAGFSVMDRRTLSTIGTVTNLTGPTIAFPAQFGDQGSTRLVVPGQNGGLLQYWLDWFDHSYGAQEAYFPSGSVNSITFADDWLVAAGVGGWCHAFDCTDSPIPDTEIVVYDNIGIVSQVRDTRDGVAILNSALRKINLTRDAGHGPKPYATFFFGHATSSFFWGATLRNGATPVFVWSGQNGYLYAFENDNTLTFKRHIAVPIAIRSAIIRDTLLIVSVAKFGLQVYRIGADFSLPFLSTLSDLPEIELLLDMPTWPGAIAAVRGNQFSRIDIANPLTPQLDMTVELTMNVLTGITKDSLLFLTGPETTGVWRLNTGDTLLALAGVTPFGGHAVASNGETMAITNGSAIYTFDLRGPTDVEDEPELLPKSSTLLVNYPNPFNPVTTIEYEVSIPGEIAIEIYNSLGQKVRTLEKLTRLIGKFNTEWNGRDDLGRTCASGTYFCRLTAGDSTRTGKMLLLK